MRTAGVWSVLLLAIMLASGCSDKRLSLYNLVHRSPEPSVATKAKALQSVDLAPASPSSVKNVAVELPFDTLQLYHKLEYTLYNRQINKNMLSRFVSTSSKRIPAQVAADITQQFYTNLKLAKIYSGLTKQEIYVHDIQLYETVNNWKIYFIFVGSEFETTGYIAGCFDANLNHYTLKGSSISDCSTFIFTAPTLLAQGLQFSVHEHNACQQGKEQLFNNIITVGQDTVYTQRIMIPQPFS